MNLVILLGRIHLQNFVGVKNIRIIPHEHE